MFENGFPREWSTIKKLAWLFRSVVNAVVAVLKTVTGNPIHILDALAKPAQALSVKLEPIQDLHGYDSPWPAGGGKNKLYVQRKNAFGIVGEYNDAGEYVITGTVDTTTVYCDFQQITLPAGSYVFSISTIPTGVTPVYTKDGAWAGTISQGTTFTLTQETVIGGYFAIPVGTTVNVAIRIQLESGSTATAWTPYSNFCPISGHTDADVIVSPTLNPLDGTTYPIPLGQTVYGGTLDVLTGLLTVTWAVSDLGTRNWAYISPVGGVPYGAFYNTVYGKANGQFNLICSAYPVKAGFANDKAIQGKTNASTVYIVDSSYNGDTVAFKAGMSGVQLCYELATPITIQLTPQQVELLQGENNIWSDGTMTLTYLADGNASEIEALNILLGNRYVNNHGEDEPSDREALDILLGRTR